MLLSAIENYLNKTKEVPFFHVFRILLLSHGYTDVHVTHGTNEFGKDLIAKFNSDGVRYQYIFQIKAGNISTGSYRNEVNPQLFTACTTSLCHPNFDLNMPRQVVLVITGELLGNSKLEMQDFNTTTVKGMLNLSPVQLWDKSILIDKFISKIDILNHSLFDERELGNFLLMYGDLKNQKYIDSFDIENYSKKWIYRDFSNSSVKLATFFESNLFVTVLLENERYYDACLVLASLARKLYYDCSDSYDFCSLNDVFFNVLSAFCDKINTLYDSHKTLIDISAPLSAFSLIEYSRVCLKCAELASLGVLLDTENKYEDKFLNLLLLFLDSEKGIYRPISDNYTISIILICEALFKKSKSDYVFKIIRDVSIWICDRYENIGLGKLGSSSLEETETCLAEILDFFEANSDYSSFLATAVIDLSLKLGDSELTADIINDFRSVNIILEFYHIWNQRHIATYEQIDISFDHNYEYLEKKLVSDIQKKEYINSTIDLVYPNYFYIMFLLRDRYFPKQLFKELYST